MTIDDVLLHMRGDAPTVVLLHGIGARQHSFDGWANVLTARHRAIRFDLPGAGLSGPDPDGNFTDDRSILLLRALLDHLGIDRATLAGNSIGGRLVTLPGLGHVPKEEAPDASLVPVLVFLAD